MKPGVRKARLESLIKEEVNKLLVSEVENETARKASVTFVSLSPDFKNAELLIDCVDRKEIGAVQHKLNLMRGYFRTRLAVILNMPYAPQIYFRPDESIDRSARIEEILNKLEK